MFIEDTFQHNRTKQFLRRIDSLKAKGHEFVQKISTNLNRFYPDHFKESKSTGTRLYLECFGLKLLIRVEIEIEQDAPGRIRTYLCDDAVPPRLQKFDFEYVFDDLGNVNREMTIGEAAERFGLELIEHLKSK